MDVLLWIVLALGAVVGVLGMVLLVVGAVASAALDHDNAGLVA